MFNQITTYILIFITGICLGYIWNYHQHIDTFQKLTAIQMEQAYNMLPSDWYPTDLTEIPEQ